MGVSGIAGGGGDKKNKTASALRPGERSDKPVSVPVAAPGPPPRGSRSPENGGEQRCDAPNRFSQRLISAKNPA